jgi:hypothetical protein
VGEVSSLYLKLWKKSTVVFTWTELRRKALGQHPVHLL